MPSDPPPEPVRKSRSGNPAVRSGQQAARARPRGKPAPPQRRHAVELPPVQTEVLPRDGASYPQLLRTEGYAWSRSLLGVGLGLSMYVLLVAVVSLLVVFLGWALTAGERPYADFAREAAAYERPIGMLAAHLGIITLIPIACLLMLVVHRMRPGWLVSVQPGFRWRYLVISLPVALASLVGVLLLAAGTQPLAPQPGFWLFLVVILLTAPVQAAAEEIFFRGYLMQALGSLVRQAWFGVVVSSVVFALLHGTQNLPLFLNRLAFGLLAALLVWRTGGLEAGIAAHAVNNVLAYVIAGLTTGIPALRAVRSVSWAQSGVQVGGFALFAVLAYLLFRALKLRRTVALAEAQPALPGDPSGAGTGLGGSRPLQ